jgi:hypothetical protein
MADVLDNGGNAQEGQQVNDTLIYGTAERLQQLTQQVWEFLKKGDEWARQAFSNMEIGNKLLLPETTTAEDLDAVEKAVQDPQNPTVEVNAIATTDQGEVVRQTVADPWGDSQDPLEPIEAVEAVIDNPQPDVTADQKPLVNEFIGKAGEHFKQNASNFIAQANAYLRENIQVEYQPIQQQDGSLALAMDTPSLLTQMQLAGGKYAEAAQEKMRSLAPQQFERVSQAVVNTQERVKSALASVSDTVRERLYDPAAQGLHNDLEQVANHIQAMEFQLEREIAALRSQVGNLESQISAMQQQQTKAEQMLSALQSRKPQLNNSRLSQWQSNFVATMKDRVQQVKQYLGEKMNQVKTKVTELVESFKQKAVEFLQPVMDRLQPVYDQAQELRQKAGEQINQVKAAVGETVDNAKRFVGEKAMDWQAQAITATATHVLAQYGKNTPQGTTIYEGERFDFYRSPNNSLSIIDRKTQQPVYQNGEFNQNAPQAVKDQLIQAAQTTKQGLDQQQAHTQAKTQAQQPKPKAVAAKR